MPPYIPSAIAVTNKNPLIQKVLSLMSPKVLEKLCWTINHGLGMALGYILGGYWAKSASKDENNRSSNRLIRDVRNICKSFQSMYIEEKCGIPSLDGLSDTDSCINNCTVNEYRRLVKVTFLDAINPFAAVNKKLKAVSSSYTAPATITSRGI